MPRLFGRLEKPSFPLCALSALIYDRAFMNRAKQFTSIGGQAIIEGVMMRSPHYIAVAVRKPNQKIVIRNVPYRSVADRFPLLKKPLLRGVVMLFESMIQGIEALSYSANVAAAS